MKATLSILIVTLLASSIDGSEEPAKTQPTKNQVQNAQLGSEKPEWGRGAPITAQDVQALKQHEAIKDPSTREHSAMPVDHEVAIPTSPKERSIWGDFGARLSSAADVLKRKGKTVVDAFKRRRNKTKFKNAVQPCLMPERNCDKVKELLKLMSNENAVDALYDILDIKQVISIVVPLEDRQKAEEIVLGVAKKKGSEVSIEELRDFIAEADLEIRQTEGRMRKLRLERTMERQINKDVSLLSDDDSARSSMEEVVTDGDQVEEQTKALKDEEWLKNYIIATKEIAGKVLAILLSEEEG